MQFSNTSLLGDYLPPDVIQALESVSGLSIEKLTDKIDAMNNKPEFVERFLDRLDDDGKALLETEGLEVSILSANHLYDLLPNPIFDRRKVAMGMNKNILYVNVDLYLSQPLTNATLHHELKHFEQIKRGDLHIDDGLNIVHWRGKAFDMNSLSQRMANGDLDAFAEYHRLPWEEEADAAYFQYLLVNHTYAIDESLDMEMAKASWKRFNGLAN